MVGRCVPIPMMSITITGLRVLPESNERRGPIVM